MLCGAGSYNLGAVLCNQGALCYSYTLQFTRNVILFILFLFLSKDSYYRKALPALGHSPGSVHIQSV